jgi:alpha-ketoglutarate-dependent 2,4-dichlorophenoxyacetate dioxygenase
MVIRPLHPLFVGEVDGVDLREPLAPATIAALHAGMDRYGVLVFHDQSMTPEQQRTMTAQLGTLELGFARVVRNRGQEPPAAPPRTGYAEVADMSNVGDDGKPVERSDRKIVGNMANQLWHSDSSFQQPAAKYSLLLAVRLPSWGGETEFCDLRAAYDGLDSRLRCELDGLEAEHFALHSRIMLGDDEYSEGAKSVFPPVLWPIVRTHPGSGRKLLFIGVHTRRVVGMTVAEGRVLLLDLLEHATQPQFVYRHTWKPGDLVIWDNRATLHRGRRWDMDEPRELRRTTTSDIDESATQPGTGESRPEQPLAARVTATAG